MSRIGSAGQVSFRLLMVLKSCWHIENKSSPEHIPRTRLATACSASNIDDLYQARSTHEQKEQGLYAVGKVATMANTFCDARGPCRTNRSAVIIKPVFH